MNREHAGQILEDELSTRGDLMRGFCGCHHLTVIEAVVAWSLLHDCSPKVREDIKVLRRHLKHLPEYNVRVES